MKIAGPIFLLGLLLLGSPKVWSEQLADDDVKLTSIISDYTEAAKRLDAYDASYFNVEEDLDKFGDYLSPDQRARSKKNVETALEKLRGIHADQLSSKNQLTYRLFKGDLDVSLKNFDFPYEDLSFNQMGSRLLGYKDDSSQALTSFPFDSVKHYDAFVKRSEGFPAYVDRQIAALRQGIKDKLVLNCVVAKKAINTYKEALEPDVEKNPFYRPVTFMPKTFSEQDHKRLATDFHKMVAERILPGYQKFDKFYQEEYLPKCRSEYGSGSYPRGKEWYAHDIEETVGLPMDPLEIHKMGLREVARISSEIEKIRKQMKFKGTRQEFLKSLGQNPKYVFKTSDELFHAFEDVKAKVAKKIPQYFSLVPQSDYKIVASSNPEDAAGSYNNPTENIPYGRFIVNTANLNAIPTYEVTTLSLHETIPGHHFQLALQFEMKGQLSEYQRKIFNSTAFVEGWALYAEYLGREMGMYEDPMQHLGNLNDEMLRAVRLVVDTGIHSLGWSRQKVIDYMVANLASDREGIETEADRYSVWPGQALAYKIGQLKIIELRKKAEKALGAKFDVREFHRVVIGNGTVSLGVLESQVDAWIKQNR